MRIAPLPPASGGMWQRQGFPTGIPPVKLTTYHQPPEHQKNVFLALPGIPGLHPRLAILTPRQAGFKGEGNRVKR